jgi:hypothetical protein
VTGQTGARQSAGEFDFCGHDARGFSPFSRGTDGSTLSLVVFSLLDVLHLVINTSMGEVAVLSLRGAMDHKFSFVVLILLQLDKSGLPMVVPGLISLTGGIAILTGTVG